MFGGQVRKDQLGSLSATPGPLAMAGERGVGIKVRKGRGERKAEGEEEKGKKGRGKLRSVFSEVGAYDKISLI